MDIDGKNGAPGPLGPSDLVIAGADYEPGRSQHVYTLMGAIGGIPVYFMDLKCFGGADPIEFLTNVLAELRARESGIVVPR